MAEDGVNNYRSLIKVFSCFVVVVVAVVVVGVAVLSTSLNGNK